MKMKASLLFGIILYLSIFPANAASLAFSGTVYDATGSGKAGVTISLSGTTLTATTDASGIWSLSESATGIASRSNSVSVQPTRHLIVEGNRLHLSFSGYDLIGRPLQHSTSGQMPIASKATLDRLASAPDTLLYSWNGTVFLRDTVSVSSRSGITATFDTTLNASIIYGWLTDARDNQIYRTVKIGTQTWMAQNLNFKVDSSGCLLDSEALCAKYGRLYTWRPAMTACPSGWHVPNDTEWNTLFTFAGKDSAGSRLKSSIGWSPRCTVEWIRNGSLEALKTDSTELLASTDTYGFHILPSGMLTFETDSTLLSMGVTKGFGIGWAELWSSTAKIANNVINVSVGEVVTELNTGNSELEMYMKEFSGDMATVLNNTTWNEHGVDAYAVRCIEN